MLQKAFFMRKDKKSVMIPFLFNPRELGIEKGNQFAEVNIPGLSAPILQFVRGNARTVNMDLLFDTYELGIDVRVHTDQITGWEDFKQKGLMDIDSELHAPPVCIFVWGAFIFECIIERVSKRFTMFLPEGVPVRATLSVSLKEYQDVDMQVKRIDFHSTDLRKRRVVIQGDSLWSISVEEFGGASDWRLIADENKLDNPRILKPGQELVIPVKG